MKVGGLMARRDNSPKKKSTARKLLQNVYELIERFGGNRQAFIKAADNLQKRIAKAEKNIGGRVDLEQLPKPIREYIQYGIVPNRVLKKYIDEAERLRVKNLESIVYRDKLFDYDDEFQKQLALVSSWEDEPEEQQAPVYISDVELTAIRSMLEDHPTNPMQPELMDYLEYAIETLGKDEVAINISIRYSQCLEVTKNALNYKAGTDRSHYWISAFKHIITGRPMTMEESIYAAEYNEMMEGEDYLL